jgi:hypothetical protein
MSVEANAGIPSQALKLNFQLLLQKFRVQLLLHQYLLGVPVVRSCDFSVQSAIERDLQYRHSFCLFQDIRFALFLQYYDFQAHTGPLNIHTQNPQTK